MWPLGCSMPLSTRFCTACWAISVDAASHRLIQQGARVLLANTAALSEQGEVFAWGWNGLGQIGLSRAHSSPQAVRIAGLPPVTRLAAGAGHVLASDELTVFAWGDNRSAACGRAAQDPVVLSPNPIHLA